MGKTLIQQARGRGGPRYRTKKKSFRVTIKYPPWDFEGDGKIVKLFNVACYSCPIAKIKTEKGFFYNVTTEGNYEGETIKIGKSENIQNGDILKLSDMPIGTLVCNIEKFKGSNGKFVRNSGICGRIVKKENLKIYIQMPSKSEKIFKGDERATIGIIAAGGRKEKPILKAGKMVHIKNAKGGKVYPRTSAVKMNIIDHPFGSGRGKRIKQKVPKRNSPPGAKVGLVRARRTGGKK